MNVIINAMKEHMPNLLSLKALPYAYGGNEEAVRMNWEFQKDYDYMSMLMQLL
jgi:hypothetical protein